MRTVTKQVSGNMTTKRVNDFSYQNGLKYKKMMVKMSACCNLDMNCINTNKLMACQLQIMVSMCALVYF